MDPVTFIFRKQEPDRVHEVEIVASSISEAKHVFNRRMAVPIEDFEISLKEGQ